MCGLGAFRLQAGIGEDDIIYLNFENKVCGIGIFMSTEHAQSIGHAQTALTRYWIGSVLRFKGILQKELHMHALLVGISIEIVTHALKFFCKIS